MKTWRKGTALLLVGLMLMSGLVAFMSAPVVVADTTAGNSRFAVVFDDAFMEDELIYDVDNADNSYFLLGEGDGVQDDAATANTLGVEISCLNDWYATGVTNASNVNVNITNYNKNVFDFTDADPSTSDIPGTGNPWAPTSATFLNDPAGTDTQTFTWTFDVLKTAGLGVDTDTTVSLRIWYVLAASGQTATIDVQIYLSSIFDDPTTNAHDILPNVVDNSGGDAPFEAGDSFKASQLELWNFDDAPVDDVQCVLTEPGNGVTLSGDRFVCEIPGTGAIDTMKSNNLTYRTDVAVGTPPGVYSGSADINYTRQDSDLVINEYGLAVDWEVDFSFLDTDPYTPTAGSPLWSPYQCQATSVAIVDDGTTRQPFIDYASPYTPPTIEQSTYSDRQITINITVENNGNTALYNVQFAIAPGGAFAPTGWDYFRNPLFFWDDVNAGTPSYDTISQTIPELAIGDSVNLTIKVTVAADIPIGVHRLPLIYDGFYFNDGSLGDATGFRPINGGDGVVNNPMADDLEVVFSIEVTDSVIACHVSNIAAGNAGDKGNINAETITVTVANDEGYNFIDVTARANFTGTPWHMPIINMANPWVVADNANPAMPFAAWDASDGAAGGTDEIPLAFTVDTDPNMTPDRYPFQLEITAVIEETLEVVTVTVDYTQGAVIDYAGYGPDIYISAFTADDIVPGDMFNLALTLENVGDDTLRDVTVTLPVDGTDPAIWDVEQQFKEQFNWTGVFDKWMDVGAGDAQTGSIAVPSDMFYTVQDLDVDNIREIYEINLYVDGIYSTPSARIAVIHINDLAPGATIDVTFDMYTDKDMVNGKPYTFPVQIEGQDSAGGAREVYNRDITVMSSLPGSSYNPVELNWFDAGIKALGLFLFFIIVLAILLFVYNMFKGEPYDEDEDDFDFDDDEPDFEPAPPPAPVEEVPAPPMEEELVEP